MTRDGTGREESVTISDCVNEEEEEREKKQKTPEPATRTARQVDQTRIALFSCGFGNRRGGKKSGKLGVERCFGSGEMQAKEALSAVRPSARPLVRVGIPWMASWGLGGCFGRRGAARGATRASHTGLRRAGQHTKKRAEKQGWISGGAAIKKMVSTE